MTAVDIYEPCDRAIKEMDRDNLREFGKLKLAKFDEVNIIRVVMNLYRKQARKARERYYEIAFEAYLIMCAECDIEPKKAQRMAEKAIDEEWVDAILTDTDLVTMYRFDTETERKAARLAEALSVSPSPQKEIDAALKAWVKQVGQYAINVTDYAAVQALEDAKVAKVEWVTEHDQRVCHECHQRDGKVYALDEVPVKPHWGCRCHLVPVIEKVQTD